MEKTKKIKLNPLIQSIKYLRSYKLLITSGFILLILSTAGKLIIPRIIEFVVDKAIIVKNMNYIILGSVVIIIITIIAGILGFYSNILNSKFSTNFAFDLRNDLYRHIHNLSFSFHDKTHTGQLLTRITSDVNLIKLFIDSSGNQLLLLTLMFIGSLSLLFYTSWILTLFVLPFIFTSFLFYNILAKKVQPYLMKAQQIIGSLNTRAKENISSIKLVKAFYRKEYEIGLFNIHNILYKNTNIKILIMFGLFIPFIFLISGSSRMIIFLTGAHQIINLNLTIGKFIAFDFYLLICVSQIDAFNSIRREIIKANVGAKRIFQILNTKSEIANEPDNKELPPIKGYVEFNKVSFRYFKNDHDILKSINFKTKPGQKIALIGKTGSGKSTIVNLIPRFYDITDGSITIDGYDIRKVNIESLRKQIGIVLQDTILFKKSIRDNIAYGKPESTIEEIINAAKAAEAHDFIMTLPEGYDTVISEKGLTLSGGQKQRIAIARTLLINPAILILDDSTSSVDSETEYRIYKALERIQKGKLCFIIAQRMSTVKKADIVIAIEKGKIVAKGKHEKLLNEYPFYADIYYSQLTNDIKEKS